MDAELTRQERRRRINRVIDYIERNLDRHMELEELASRAPFSKYHFHRVFKEELGETVSQFVRRVRLEAAANYLAFRKNMTVSDIAMHCGFSSSQNFARAFKNQFSQTPLEYRTQYQREYRTLAETGENIRRKNRHTFGKNGHIDGKNGNANKPETGYLSDEAAALEKNIYREYYMEKLLVPEPEMREMPRWRVAYVRGVGKYCKENIKPLFDKLLPWAGARELVNESSVILGVGWDNPDVTPAEKCRFDAAITVPEDFETDGDFALGEIPAGKYAVFRFRVASDDIALAWRSVVEDWLPKSGFVPDMRPCYELYHKCSESEDVCEMDICMAVRPR